MSVISKIIDTLLEALDTFDGKIDYSTRRDIEILKEKINDIDLEEQCTLETNMSCALQDAGIDGVVRIKNNNMNVSTHIFFSNDEFSFVQDEGRWFLTSVRLRHQNFKNGPVIIHEHNNLHIGGYTNDDMMYFVRHVLPVGNNISINKFFNMKIW